MCGGRRRPTSRLQTRSCRGGRPDEDEDRRRNGGGNQEVHRPMRTVQSGCAYAAYECGGWEVPQPGPLPHEHDGEPNGTNRPPLPPRNGALNARHTAITSGGPQIRPAPGWRRSSEMDTEVATAWGRLFGPELEGGCGPKMRPGGRPVSPAMPRNSPPFFSTPRPFSRRRTAWEEKLHWSASPIAWRPTRARLAPQGAWTGSSQPRTRSEGGSPAWRNRGPRLGRRCTRALSPSRAWRPRSARTQLV